MKKVGVIILAILIINLLVMVSAEKYTLTIRGEPRTLDGKVEFINGAGLVSSNGIIPSNTSIDNKLGFFEVKDAILDTGAEVKSVSVFAEGTCFYYVYNIHRVGDHFEVTDGYAPERGVILSTKERNIDLGGLKEEKSNRVMVDFDVSVSFKAEDLAGNWVAENSGFTKFTGMTNSFQPRTTYSLILKNERGDEWRRTITTGDYCVSTRVIKRGSYFVVENFPNNGMPPISFFKNIWLSLLGFKMIVIIPLIIAILVIITLLYFIFRKKQSSDYTSASTQI